MTIQHTIKCDETDWLADQDNIQILGEWLAEKGQIETVTECLRFFEKPWKWSDEYRQMIGEKAGTHGACEQCDKITDQKTGDGQFVCSECIEF